jgi:hypothetical protein
MYASSKTHNGKDSQWGPADEQTDDDNSTKQADPTDFRVPGQDADKSVLGSLDWSPL